MGIVPELTIGQRLRVARELTGLEQREFASEIGISRTSVSALEGGRSKPRQLTLRAWSSRTGVSLHWLETGEAPSPGGGDGALAPVSLLPESNRRPSYYE
ncbi:helix-turn-helix domain-containing protein [Brevibacterium otitidis]|uniref:Helix-turn-helix domain-containing protein n=1 Tax=Brevibacterium otitidis TaxID=53364 RepID=A0ABV5WYZ6_9MICO